MNLYTCAVCASAGYTRCSGRTSVYSRASSVQNLAVPHDLILFSVSRGTILLTLYSMVWDCWRVSRAGPMLFYCLGCSISFCPLLFCWYCLVFYWSTFVCAVYRSALWGWGLWTDRVQITLSQPCTADSFNNNNNNYYYIIRYMLYYYIITYYILYYYYYIIILLLLQLLYIITLFAILLLHYTLIFIQLLIFFLSNGDKFVKHVKHNIKHLKHASC